MAIRLSPELFETVRSLNSNVSQAVEQALLAWIKRERRKVDPLVKLLRPPTAREIAARKTSDAA